MWIVMVSFSLLQVVSSRVFGEHYEPQIQQTNLPFRVSRTDPFLGKSPESGLGICTWFAFMSGNTGCPHSAVLENGLVLFDFSGGC